VNSYIGNDPYFLLFRRTQMGMGKGEEQPANGACLPSPLGAAPVRNDPCSQRRQCLTQEEKCDTRL